VLFAVATAASDQVSPGSFPPRLRVRAQSWKSCYLTSNIGGRSPARFRSFASSRGLYIETTLGHGIACCKPRIQTAPLRLRGPTH